MEPVPALLTENKRKHIIGVRANVWNEYISPTQQVEYMLLPRIAALAEVQWTQPKIKNYQDLAKYLVNLITFYEKDGLNCVNIYLILKQNINLIFNTKQLQLT